MILWYDVKIANICILFHSLCEPASFDLTPSSSKWPSVWGLFSLSGCLWLLGNFKTLWQEQLNDRGPVRTPDEDDRQLVGECVRLLSLIF